MINENGTDGPESFNERLYFLMVTTLRWILEVVTLPIQVPSSQLTPAVIYGRCILLVLALQDCRTGHAAECKFQSRAFTNITILEF